MLLKPLVDEDMGVASRDFAFEVVVCYVFDVRFECIIYYFVT